MTAGVVQAPDWDLTPYFSGLGADDYRSFRAELERELAALLARAEAMPEPSEREAWVELLVDLEEATARHWHLLSFLACVTAADSTDELGQAEEASFASQGAVLDKITAHVRAALGAAPDEAFAALAADRRLEPVAYHLERLRRDAGQRMPVELEALRADLGVDGIEAWGRLYDRISGSLEFELRVGAAAPRRLPVSRVRSLREHADAEVRRAAHEGSAAAWQSVADPVAACLNAISGTRLTLQARRGIAHFLEPALFDAGIERATLDAMWEAVRGRQDVARRYLRHKARLLGMERLGYPDLRAPLPREGEARIGWEEGVSRVCDAFDAAYPELGAFAARAIGRRWIDHGPRPGKRPGGFCTGSPLIGESRIFMTYDGAMGDVQTLAHELGHAYHSWLMRDMRTWTRIGPMTLAETASTFAEKLVTDAALGAAGTSEAERTALLDQRLQDAESMLLDIPARFDFEYGLYTQRGEGELSVSELKERMCAAQRSSYGDGLAPDSLDPWFWASKLHFYITGVSFYNFPYTFGYLLSMAIYTRAKQEGASFLPRYEAFLRATGSAPAERVVAETLGFDLAQPSFWDAAIDPVEADLDAFVAATGG